MVRANGFDVAQLRGQPVVDVVGGLDLRLNKPRTSTAVGVIAQSQVSGLVLVRGHRLDGPGTMSFALGPATSPSQSELDLNVDAQTRRWDVSVQADTRGLLRAPVRQRPIH